VAYPYTTLAREYGNTPEEEELLSDIYRLQAYIAEKLKGG
jgi:hypothetical protein